VRRLLACSGTEGDGRAVVVCLTESDAALIDRGLVIHTRVVHETLVAKCSETERTALLRTLSQIGQWSVLMAFSPDANGDSSWVPTPGKYRARQPGEEPHCQQANVTQLACC